MSDDLRAARVSAVVAVETKQERLMGFNVMRMATIAPLRMEECFAIVEEKKRVKAPRPAHWVQKLKEDKVPWGFAFIRTRSSRGGDFMKYLTWLEYPDKSKKRRPSTPLPIKGAEGLPRRTIEQWTEVDASASGPEEFCQMRKTSQYFRDRQFRPRWVWAYDPESRKLVRGKPQLPKTDGDRYDDCVKAYWDDMWTWFFAVWRAGTKSGGVSHGVFVIREKRKLGDVGVF
ncbi:hypothetical protein BKA61DRAFT_572397 [Leptodontidium sp. MPI-SDFR-AT-0119]|nr:hypothetical protein BKA61DRAFT_572397 [Leptodontidium sp. MPI-SDFR-AT-0119]